MRKIGLTPRRRRVTPHRCSRSRLSLRLRTARRAKEFLVDYDAVSSESNVLASFCAKAEMVGPRRAAQNSATTSRRTRRISEAERSKQKVTSPDSNLQIIEDPKRYADEHEAQYGRFPKTLIFADNDARVCADQLVGTARCSGMVMHCQKITRWSSTVSAHP